MLTKGVNADGCKGGPHKGSGFKAPPKSTNAKVIAAMTEARLDL